LRSVLENSPETVVVLDQQGLILNAVWSKEDFARQQNMKAGESYPAFIHPGDRAQFEDAMRALASAPLARSRWEGRIHDAGGNYRWVDSTITSQYLDSAEAALVVYQRDVHSRRTEEAERLEELTRSNLRLEEFAYTAAHDLREPLRAIALYTQILFKDIAMDAETRQMVEFVRDGTARMFTLIESLLSYARTGAYEPTQDVDLGRAAAQAIQNLSTEIAASHANVIVGHLPTLRSNEIQLVRLFQNLLSNAIKFRGARPLEINVTAEQTGQDWSVKITDNGLGISCADQSRIFEPFVRLANPAIRGTGLGLAVCKKIVEGMGGSLRVESALGLGSAFIFTLGSKDSESGKWNLATNAL
jgi:signal transduction histidine kinase